MENQLSDLKEYIYKEIADIKADIKSLIQTTQVLSETLKEYKELNKTLQTVLVKQDEQTKNIDDLYNKYDIIYTRCPNHIVQLTDNTNRIDRLEKITYGVIVALVITIAQQIIRLIIK